MKTWLCCSYVRYYTCCGRKLRGTQGHALPHSDGQGVKEVLMEPSQASSELLIAIRHRSFAYELEVSGTVVVKLNKSPVRMRRVRKAVVPEPVVHSEDSRAGRQVPVATYDILCASDSHEDNEWLASELRAKYGEVSLIVGTKHSYLGQTIDFAVKGEVKVYMEGYIRAELTSSGSKDQSHPSWLLKLMQSWSSVCLMPT